MSKKFAVCFSGYPRFVRKQFDSIKKNILDGLGEYDTYAYFQWKDDWQNQQIHHEYTDKFEVNELEEFKELYEPLNLKKIEVIKPYNFDEEVAKVTSADPTMGLTLEQAQDVFYRMKCQFQGMYDCAKLIDNLDDYEYIIRMRTDLIPLSEIDLSGLEADAPLNQDGFVAGPDRPWSDWFFIVPVKHIRFLEELAMGPQFQGSLMHTHTFIQNIGSPYALEHHNFNIRTPTARGVELDQQNYHVFAPQNQIKGYTIIKR